MAGLATNRPAQPQSTNYFGMAYSPANGSGTNTMTGNTRIAGQQPNGSVNYSPQNMYNAALPQTARDYDSIMEGFRGVLNRSNNQAINSPNTQLRQTLTNELNRGPVGSTDVKYNPTADVTGALSTLRGYSQDGGYTAEDVRSLRERGISPIRAVYANANRNLKRQRSLQGGYAPGMTAATTRMAREMSDQIANQVTNVNASIADRQASGRREMAGAYGNLASSESGRYLSADTGNADRRLEAARTNAASRSSILSNLAQLQELDRQPGRDALAALDGMRTLYGTTPALANTFGDQSMRATQNVQNQQQQGFNNRVTAQQLQQNNLRNQYAPRNMGNI